MKVMNEGDWTRHTNCFRSKGDEKCARVVCISQLLVCLWLTITNTSQLLCNRSLAFFHWTISGLVHATDTNSSTVTTATLALTAPPRLLTQSTRGEPVVNSDIELDIKEHHGNTGSKSLHTVTGIKLYATHNTKGWWTVFMNLPEAKSCRALCWDI